MNNHCARPSGWLGRLLLRNMNKRHSSVTDWGLSHISIPRDGAILDLGCGGGRTIAKLAAASGTGKVFGLDHSAESVRLSSLLNAALIQSGRVTISSGSVSQLPFAANSFNLVTAVETHFFWPSLPEDVREALRVTKPSGIFLIIAEVYKGSGAIMSKLVERNADKTGMTLLSPEQHRELLFDAGFEEVEVFTEPTKGWICAIGRKPAST